MIEYRVVSDSVFSIEADGILYFGSHVLIDKSYQTLIDLGGPIVGDALSYLTSLESYRVQAIPAGKLDARYLLISPNRDWDHTYEDLFYKALITATKDYQIHSIGIDASVDENLDLIKSIIAELEASDIPWDMTVLSCKG